MENIHPLVVDLLRYIDASPTPFHCVDESVRRLVAAGFARLREEDAWELSPGGQYFFARGGALVAFRLGAQRPAEGGFRVIGAHTDSPNLRVKPMGDYAKDGFVQLGVEVYGGCLTYTWLDRDLGLAGRVMFREKGDEGVHGRLVRIDRPLARVPSLAIHLQRDYVQKGLKLNPQTHLAPVLSVGLSGGRDPGEDADDTHSPGSLLRQLLGDTLGISPETILSWDLSLMDLAPSTVGGLRNELIFAPRLDNQGMCHAALVSLMQTEQQPRATQVVCLYDHEEVGSVSTAGAGGPLVENTLQRLAELEGPGAIGGGMMRAVARSYQLSADMAHALHPNHSDKHEPQHQPRLNAGPVIKVNAQQRYATDAETAALFASVCQSCDIPYQRFVARTDMSCGSTIGPISAGRVGLPTVDVGNPMLSMHAVRELAGADDVPLMVRAMTHFLAI